jgi:hypothetical protein
MSIEKTTESINYTNWYTKFVKSGTALGVTTTETDPNVQLRIVNGETSSSGSVSYPDFLINPELTSFDFNMEVYWTPTESTGGDNYQITFGSTMRLSILFNFWDDYVNNGLSGAGVYILNSSNAAVLKSTTAPGSKGPGSDQWYPVRVIYNKNAVNTWTVMINGTTVLTYSDPNAQTWQQVANNKGVTVSAVSGVGLKMGFFLRRLNLAFKAMMPILTEKTSAMPQKFYPSADDSTFAGNRAAYARTLYPRITNTATAAQITKQKLVYNRHDASSRMERLKLQAIGQSSMRLKETDTLQFKAPNVNDVREALSRSRSQGYMVPPKCQNR